MGGETHEMAIMRKKYEDGLDKTLAETDVQFLKNLSEFIIKFYGNVNVAQCLNCIRIKYVEDGNSD